jgi:transcriptional regulator with XRE-family HTH domain
MTLTTFDYRQLPVPSGTVADEYASSSGASDLGSRIRAARERRHMTQDALARKLGVRTETVSSWERNRRMPRSRMGALREELPDLDRPAAGGNSDRADRQEHRGLEDIGDFVDRSTGDLWLQLDQCIAELLRVANELKRRNRAAQRRPPHGAEMPLPAAARTVIEKGQVR